MKTRSLKQITVAARKKVERRIQHKPSGKRVLKLKKAQHSPSPVYLSGKYVEYFIKQDEFGYFYLKAYRGVTPKALHGRWSYFDQAERALTRWLEKTDKRAQSRYPGCPERKETNYTRTFLAE